MRRLGRVTAVGSVVVFGVVLSGCSPAWHSELVSVAYTGDQSGNGLSSGQVFSPDGTQVAFTSTATSLHADDPYEQADVFLRDLATGTTTLLSVNAAGTSSGNGSSAGPVFSPDGTKVAFTSAATDLGPADESRWLDVYLRDLTTNTTSLVSVRARPVGPLETRSSTSPVFSPDGTKIAFQSGASFLGPRDTNGANDVYVRDLVSGTTELVSVNVSGTDAGHESYETLNMAPVFSPDSLKIAFYSRASDLVVGDTNDARDVFVRDLSTDITTMVSTNAAGTNGGDAFSWNPTFSPDGARVMFVSAASDLGPNDTNGEFDIYLKDLSTGAMQLVSSNVAGTDAGNGQAVFAAFHPDGRRVALVTAASDLGPTDTNGAGDVYLKDLVTGDATLISTNHAGTDSANGGSANPAISADGTRIAFSGTSTNFGFTDTNVRTDVFVRDLRSGTLSLVTSSAADSTRTAQGLSTLATWQGGNFSPDGTQILFQSSATDLDPLKRDNDLDIFIGSTRGA